jgi:hypothetical protein
MPSPIPTEEEIEAAVVQKLAQVREQTWQTLRSGGCVVRATAIECDVPLSLLMETGLSPEIVRLHPFTGLLLTESNNA